jgi:flagellar basal-body rod protein FlgC
MRVPGLGAMDVSRSALSAYKRQMETIAENLANAQTTRTGSGSPYRRKVVVFSPEEAAQAGGRAMSEPVLDLSRTLSRHAPAAPFLRGRGPAQGLTTVRVAAVEEDPSPFLQVYDPTHPDADENGMVRYPNVESAQEMVSLVIATRSYEANLAALAAARRIQEITLQMGRSV